MANLNFLVYNYSMRGYLTKTICLILFISVFLLVGASPVLAHNSMSLANCQDNTCGETTTAPVCCNYGDCSVAHNVIINLTLPSGRLSPNINKIYPVSQPSSIANPAPILSNIKPLDTGPNQNSPPTCGTNYCCRNCLTQEEPPLL